MEDGELKDYCRGWNVEEEVKRRMERELAVEQVSSVLWQRWASRKKRREEPRRKGRIVGGVKQNEERMEREEKKALVGISSE